MGDICISTLIQKNSWGVRVEGGGWFNAANGQRETALESRKMRYGK